MDRTQRLGDKDTRVKVGAFLPTERLGFILLTLVGVGLHLIHLTAPLTEKHSWRQADVAMIAGNFFRNGFDIRYPQINWAGALPGYVGTEFPLVPYVTALLYGLFGEHLFLGRLVSIFFALLGTIFFYLLVRRYFSARVALLSLFFYIFSPLNLFYTRTLMPESAMLAFSIGAIYFFARWSESRHTDWGDYFIAALLTMLSLLVKIPSAIIGLPMAYLAYKRYGWSMFRRWKLWLFAALVAVPVVAWYTHSLALSMNNYPHHMFGENVWLWSGWLSAFLDFGIYQKIALQVTAFLLTPLGLLCALGGLLLMLRRKQPTYLFHFWALALVFYFFYGLRGHYLHEYYQLPFVPVAAFFAGIFMDALAEWIDNKQARQHAVYSYGFYAVLGVTAISAVLLFDTRFYSPSAYVLYQAGQTANEVLPKDALIISADWNDPVLIYASHRKGWHFPGHMLFKGQYDRETIPIAELPWTASLVEELRQDGAEFFVAPTPYDAQRMPTSLLQPIRQKLVAPPDTPFLQDWPAFKQYMDNTYPIILDNRDAVIYDLRQPLAYGQAE